MSKKTTENKKTGLKEPWYWNWFAKNVYLGIFAFCITLFLLSQTLKFITRHNVELTVPAFTGMTIDEAQREAELHNLRIAVTDSIHSNKIQPGTIFKQNPPEGSKVKKNRRILLTVNGVKPKMVPMPLLEGYSLRQAQTELNAAQLKVGKLVYVEDIATNNVIAQYYMGKKIKPGTPIPADSEIDLEVGKNTGDNHTYIPDLLGVRYEELKNMLTEKSLNLAKAVFSDEILTYTDSLDAFVYRQEPEPSYDVPVPIGTKITVYLQKASPTEEMQ